MRLVSLAELNIKETEMTAMQATLAIINRGKTEAKELPNCSIPHLRILHLLRLLKSLRQPEQCIVFVQSEVNLEVHCMLFVYIFSTLRMACHICKLVFAGFLTRQNRQLVQC